MMLGIELRNYNMSYREDELDAAIEKYVDGLDLEGLVDYVTADMTSVYYKAERPTVDEFISQMNGE